MADFTLSKSLFSGKYRNASSTPGNIAYALFVLFCFWAGAQLLNLLVHAPGVYERLMQVQETGRPRVEIGLGVGTIFGQIGRASCRERRERAGVARDSLREPD